MNTRLIERYVEPEVTDARIARQWAGTEQRMAEMGRAQWKLPALALAAAASVLLVFFVAHLRKPDGLTVGALLESTGPQALTLNDGSRVDLASHSRLHVNALEPKRIELALEQGSASFDVRHIAGRSFVVEVGPFEIVDEGTRFVVDLAPAGSITVSVEQGAVRIQRRGSPEPARFLSAGERWSMSTPPPADTSPTDTSDASAATVPPSASPSVAPSAIATDAPLQAEPGPTPRATPASPREILETAQRAQRDGRLRDAAAAYDRLRRDYRGDGRAGLAAFELGRLRLGPLGDPRGAAQAFRDAIRLSPTAPFREDAAAHLVEAFDAAGDAARCDAARRAYVADYPHGLHAASVSARCARTP